MMFFLNRFDIESYFFAGATAGVPVVTTTVTCTAILLGGLTGGGTITVGEVAHATVLYGPCPDALYAATR